MSLHIFHDVRCYDLANTVSQFSGIFHIVTAKVQSQSILFLKKLYKI